MIKFKIDETKYNLPENLNEVKLGEYETWFGDPIKFYEDKVNLVEKVTKIPKEEILQMPITLFDTICSILFSLQEKTENIVPKNSIIIDNVNYTISFKNELTIGEYADIEFIMEQLSNEHKLSRILAILCRPVNEKYDMKNNDKRQRMFQNISVSEAMPLLAFFLQLKKSINQNMKYYSVVKEHINQLPEVIRSLQINGDGIKHLTIWQRVQYWILMQSLKKQLLKFSTT